MPEPYIRRSDLPYTASQIFSLFADEKDAAFLDSSLENKLGQYAIIGLVPYHTVSVEKGRLRVDGKYHPGTAEAYLKDYLARHHQKNYSDLPLTSGAVGYVTYDYGMKPQGVISRHAPKATLAEMKWVFYDFFIIEDLKDHSLWFIANGHTEAAPELWKLSLIHI